MNISFEYITNLEYRLKEALNEIAAFKSGEKYIQMEEYFWGIIHKSMSFSQRHVFKMVRFPIRGLTIFL